jgi:hypothetical protein
MARAAKKSPIVEMKPRARPVHIQRAPFSKDPRENRTLCGRSDRAVVLAERVRQATCQRCLAELQKVSAEQSQRIGVVRNKIEARAKAAYEVWARGLNCQVAWEHLYQEARNTWYDVVDYLQAVFEDEAQEARERPD